METDWVVFLFGMVVKLIMLGALAVLAWVVIDLVWKPEEVEEEPVLTPVQQIPTQMRKVCEDCGEMVGVMVSYDRGKQEFVEECGKCGSGRLW